MRNDVSKNNRCARNSRITQTMTWPLSSFSEALLHRSNLSRIQVTSQSHRIESAFQRFIFISSEESRFHYCFLVILTSTPYCIHHPTIPPFHTFIVIHYRYCYPHYTTCSPSTTLPDPFVVDIIPDPKSAEISKILLLFHSSTSYCYLVSLSHTALPHFYPVP